ncbi:MAG: M23 family metallopeptidase [Saprospiraceae bacterium]|nr:M23 family metallopeptidase [Saprospiraceae bacterium]
MKNINLTASVLVMVAGQLWAQPPFSLTDGVYRLPYADGTSMNTNRDHFAHTPQGAYDLAGTGGGPYQVAAAASGVIRAIDDAHDNTCNLPNCGCNNYVWIEHPNGEWSKYTHMSQGSVTGNGWSVGDIICAGDILGPEDDIGCASGDHLHFEVGRPFDVTNPFTVAGGFMGAAGLGDYLIPIFCGVSDYILDDSDDGLTANPCDNTVCPAALDFMNLTHLANTYTVEMAALITASTNVTYSPGSAGMYQGGTSVVLSPGFTAQSGSEFRARIGPCNTPPWTLAACPSFMVQDPNELMVGPHTNPLIIRELAAFGFPIALLRQPERGFRLAAGRQRESRSLRPFRSLGAKLRSCRPDEGRPPPPRYTHGAGAPWHLPRERAAR